MSNLPRLAVGTIQPAADLQPFCWALLDVLCRLGPQVQAFCSQSRFPVCDGAAPTTGQCHRHLDSWLMSRDVCREIFYHGTRSCDLALVEGKYSGALDTRPGGSLDRLCEWLDLPRLVVLDAAQLRKCALPLPPEHLDGVFLDRPRSVQEAAELRAEIEALWCAPVLGYLPDEDNFRSVVSTITKGKRPSREICHALGNQLAPSLNVPRLLELAQGRGFPTVPANLFRAELKAERLNVAVAYDEAFHCYFCDTLDLLELRGATIRDFSPLRGEMLPPDTDLVLFGCGQIEHLAQPLAENHCLMQDLRRRVESGGRVYAEGSGLAYLCQQVILPDGRWYPMSGLLPAIARHNPAAPPPEPVELTLASDTWLAGEGVRLRGYLNTAWQIEPCGPLASHAAEGERSLDLVGRKQIIGSRMHLNFAAQPALLPGLFHPHACAAG